MNNNIDFLGKLFFTAEDTSITGKSQRDPLGLQPIWSFYGRKVINHLTTISTTLHGFREVLLCLSICSDVKDIQNKSFSYPQLILLFEQLFIYTAISKKDKRKIDGILGGDNGSLKFEEEGKNPIISHENTILVREISLGYYGRYRTPLTTMKIINSKGELEKGINEIVKDLYGKERYQQILDGFKDFIEKSNYHFKNFNEDVKTQLFEAVFGKFRPGEKEFWEERLGITYGLMNICYNSLDENSNESIGKIAKEVFYSILQTEKNENIKNIVSLEQYLICLEEIFYKAMVSENLNSITINNIEEHKKRYDEFCNISITDIDTGLLKNRMSFLRKNCNPNLGDYITNIILYHKSVCEQKRSSTWVDFESDGKLQTFVESGNNTINIDNWNRDYYLSSLKSIKSEILEFTNE